MRAITYDRFGPAADVLTLAEQDSTAPGQGEVAVSLVYSAVNPSDVKARSGARPGVTHPPFPTIIPHSDGAGVITKAGPGVDPARIGQRVWIWNGQWQRPFGTAAETITLPEAQAVPMPDAMSDEQGAVMGIPGLTAAQVVFGGGDVAGKTLLVQGGAGTVGYLAVQLAKRGGAHVIATARGAGIGRCRDAGADAVIDYAARDCAAQILQANAGREVDRIIEVEFGANIGVTAEVIAPCGTVAVYGSALNMTPEIPFGSLLFKAVSIDISLIYILPDPQRHACIDRLHDAVTAGALHCPVAEKVPLAETARAHELVERGSRTGAVLIDVRA
ncbi:NADPH:quinone reductase [uncultured Roseobacter sp.]|uniref:NADPH:quinone reductase n=1 Tax=uncultured Roseobacter sp. TaxID=114847 RepID=UPI002607818C|nr:NADPH:quinone reductase [uncultured Roseobacter sp.]